MPPLKSISYHTYLHSIFILSSPSLCYCKANASITSECLYLSLYLHGIFILSSPSLCYCKAKASITSECPHLSLSATTLILHGIFILSSPSLCYCKDKASITSECLDLSLIATILINMVQGSPIKTHFEITWSCCGSHIILPWNFAKES